MEKDNRYSLRQLNMMVRETIEDSLPDEYWVEAEFSECRENSGHCYMELIEKDERSNTPIARASAKCWRQTWMMVKPYFERTTGQPLRAGMKVLLRVYAQFHEAYGFSWIVSDIDPTYTLGDMARKRQEIIRQLKEEGELTCNASCAFPPLPSVLPSYQPPMQLAMATSAVSWRTTNTDSSLKSPFFPLSCRANKWSKALSTPLSKSILSPLTPHLSPLSSTLLSSSEVVVPQPT